MVVALSATDGLPEPYRADSPDAIGELARFVILGLRSTLFGREQKSIESRGDLLLHSSTWQQIPSQLLAREAIKRNVLIE